MSDDVRNSVLVDNEVGDSEMISQRVLRRAYIIELVQSSAWSAYPGARIVGGELLMKSDCGLAGSSEDFALYDESDSLEGRFVLDARTWV